MLVIANTTRRIDPALLEAAETLGASRRVLITRVVVPGVITEIYTDMRVLLGWAWTYLIVAELIGVSSGITYFINQQAKYRNYERVFASIFLIGIIGLVDGPGAGVAGAADVSLACGRRGAAGSPRWSAPLRGRRASAAIAAGEAEVAAVEEVARA